MARSTISDRVFEEVNRQALRHGVEQIINEVETLVGYDLENAAGDRDPGLHDIQCPGAL
jgi:hypothetical protein